MNGPNIDSDTYTPEANALIDDAWEAKSISCKLAANIRWAKERMSAQFLSSVDLYAKNHYFSRRAERAAIGLNDNYLLEDVELAGKYRKINAVRVTDANRGVAYLVRFYHKPGRASGLAACTCKDFNDKGIRYKMPCKHILMAMMKTELADLKRFFPEEFDIQRG